MNKTTKQFPVLKDFPWSNKGAASCIAFCYPQRGIPFIIKGEFKIVHKHLEINDQPIFVHYKIYGSVTHKCHVVYGLEPEYKIDISHKLTRMHPVSGLEEKHQRYWIRVYQNNSWCSQCVHLKSIRSLPRKWMKDFDIYVKAKHKRSDPIIGAVKVDTLFSDFNKSEYDPAPALVELTEEEKEEHAAIVKSQSVTSSLLKRVWAMPLNHNVSIFEIDEEALEALEKVEENA